MKITKVKIDMYERVQMNVRTQSGHLTRLYWFWSAGVGFRRNDMFIVTLPKRYHKDFAAFISGKRFKKRLTNAVRQAAGHNTFMRKLEGLDL